MWQALSECRSPATLRQLRTATAHGMCLLLCHSATAATPCRGEIDIFSAFRRCAMRPPATRCEPFRFRTTQQDLQMRNFKTCESYLFSCVESQDSPPTERRDNSISRGVAQDILDNAAAF